MKRSITLVMLCIASISTFAQLNLEYVGNITYDQILSDIWGYVAPDDTEYGIVGVFDGVSVVSIADPANPTEVDFVPGANSGWRDIKTWKDFAYVINETANGLAVIDLSTLPDSVVAYDWTPDIPDLGTLSTCHNIFIDEFGYAYISGCNLNAGGILVLNVDTPDGTPEYITSMPAIYSHDVYARNNILYSSDLNIGQFTIYDVSDKENIQPIGDHNTPFNFTHNTWPSDDETILFTTDELANAPVGSYDISDPGNIQELDQFRPYETLGDGVIPHNVHVWNDWLIISYYTDGCIIVDGSRPENLVEVGNFDTFIPATTGFSGAWGAYPFLPSSLVLVSDIGNGMYVLEPTYVRACWLEGNITNANTSDPILGAEVEILNTNVFETSDIAGDYKTGLAIAGTYEVQVHKAGYEPFTGQAVLENDVVTILNVELVPLPSFAMTGTVVDAADGTGIPNAIVNIINDDFDFNIETDANGNFVIASAFEGTYNAFAGKWGYSTVEDLGWSFDENNSSVIIELTQGYQDPFQLDLGWSVESTAFIGEFERGTPQGIFVPQAGYFINPQNDVPDDVGTRCYETAIGTDPNSDVLLGGTTSIISPTFDLSNLNEPMISYAAFLWTVNIVEQDPTLGNATLEVILDNGFETVTVETITYEDLFTPPEWYNYEINVQDIFGSNPDSLSNLRIEFTAISDGFQQIAEVAVDHFLTWDASPTNVGDLLSLQTFEASPNPSISNFNIQYKLESFDSDSQLVIFNALGQRVQTFELNDITGTIGFGGDFEKGIYFAQILQQNNASTTIRLVKQ